MLELRTKWFTNSLAKKSMLNNDFIQCSENKRLYVVSYGNITSSGKNTYNVVLKDSDDKVLEEHSNLYLDAITKLFLSTSPKAKANKEKETNENKPKEAKKQTKEAKECLYLTFEEAFGKACKMLNEHYEIKELFSKYSKNATIDLTMYIQHEARRKEHQRIKDAKKQSELVSLRQTLEIAKEQGNAMLVDAINEMITNKEKE